MILLKEVKDLQNYISHLKRTGRKVGFVPTMGALHQGHLSLISKAKSECEAVVCSIFVNPTQFNDQSDLNKYPRTLDQDIELLESKQTDILFFPPVDEVYPKELDTTLSLEFGSLDKVMEGIFRPGHFDGMAQVVKRLLDIVDPDRLYMGQKDYQQFSIVNEMIRQLKLPVKLVLCPIIREEDGLAMSSRNRRLDQKIRLKANIIYQTLIATKEQIEEKDPSTLMDEAIKKLTFADFKPEYFDIVDGFTLERITNFNDHELVTVCTAVWAGEIRLIDNMILKGNYND